MPEQPKPKRHQVILYANGFIVDGEFRDYKVPANQQFLQLLTQG